MKDFMRGKVDPWKHWLPCLPMYSATHDWGTIENRKFEIGQLTR